MKKQIKIIFIENYHSKDNFKKLFKIIKELDYNRLLVESGLVFLNSLLKHKLIFNIFVFKSSVSLLKKDQIMRQIVILKLNLNHRVKVNLHGDNLYKVKIRNV